MKVPTFKEQIGGRLVDLVDRDGFVDHDVFVQWAIDQLALPDWPMKPQTVELLRLAFEELINEVLTDDELAPGLGLNYGPPLKIVRSRAPGADEP